MRKTATLILLFLISNMLFAQSTKQKLLIDKAFDRMVINDVTYAIFGESSPTNGIKLDLSKPEATISGVFKSKKIDWILIGFDFKGGITDKTFKIYEGLSNFNSAFEIRPNFHFIPDCNSAWFKTSELPIIKAKNKLVSKDSAATIDTFLIINSIYNQHFKNMPNLLFQEDIIKKSLEKIDTGNDTVRKKLLLYFIKQLNIKDIANLSIENSVDVLLNKIPIAEKDKNDLNVIETYNNSIVDLFEKYKAIAEVLADKSISQQILNAKKAWTKKSLKWFTVSPFIRTEGLNLYYTKLDNVDSLYFKKTNPFFYGISGSTNFLCEYPKLINYLKLGINILHSNNLATLTPFNYETRTTFFSYPNNVTEKIKTGTAYNQSDFKQNTLTQLSFEYYLLPLNNFLPGLYINGNLGLSSLYKLPDVEGRENDESIFSIEGGPVFNINSREKDKEKSILSISLYARFEDLSDNRRTSISTRIVEKDDDYLNRNLSFGIKVGVPITLPERNK